MEDRQSEIVYDGQKQCCITFKHTPNRHPPDDFRPGNALFCHGHFLVGWWSTSPLPSFQPTHAARPRARHRHWRHPLPTSRCPGRCIWCRPIVVSTNGTEKTSPNVPNAHEINGKRDNKNYKNQKQKNNYDDKRVKRALLCETEPSMYCRHGIKCICICGHGNTHMGCYCDQNQWKWDGVWQPTIHQRCVSGTTFGTTSRMSIGHNRYNYVFLVLFWFFFDYWCDQK